VEGDFPKMQQDTAMCITRQGWKLVNTLQGRPVPSVALPTVI